jgi:hypothetical protein
MGCWVCSLPTHGTIERRARIWSAATRQALVLDIAQSMSMVAENEEAGVTSLRRLEDTDLAVGWSSVGGEDERQGVY